LKEFAFRISSVAVVVPGQTLTVIALLVIARLLSAHTRYRLLVRVTIFVCAASF
jgi:hypothetical protein